MDNDRSDDNQSSIEIIIDPAFQLGSLNEPSFTDLPSMSPEQKTRLADFIQKVANGTPLCGKNKESWLDDQLNELPHTSSYRDGNYWHYHCGPYPNTVGSMTFNLERNLYGLTSSEVVHYVKDGKNHITIVGFSPEHIPFPRSDIGYNPLFDAED